MTRKGREVIMKDKRNDMENRASDKERPRFIRILEKYDFSN